MKTKAEIHDDIDEVIKDEAKRIRKVREIDVEDAYFITGFLTKYPQLVMPKDRKAFLSLRSYLSGRSTLTDKQLGLLQSIFNDATLFTFIEE
jgi:hypothetical protein